MGLNLSDVGRVLGALPLRLHRGVDVVQQTVNPDTAACEGTAHAAALAAGETLRALQRETPRLIARLGHDDPGAPRDAGRDRSERVERGPDAACRQVRAQDRS